VIGLFVGMLFWFKNAADRPIDDQEIWEFYTLPLNTETQSDLCEKYSLGMDEAPCDPNMIVYAPEFYQVIKESIVPDVTTYNKFSEKLAAYEVACNETSAYLICVYDLSGDRKSSLIVNFDGDGSYLVIEINHINTWED
ncbi:MAG: hypothetical protein N2D54_01095, partial [Chloroflexota bacterium]